MPCPKAKIVLQAWLFSPCVPQKLQEVKEKIDTNPGPSPLDTWSSSGNPAPDHCWASAYIQWWHSQAPSSQGSHPVYSCACLWVELLPGPWPTVWFGVLFHYPLLLVPTLPPPSGWVSQCFSCRNLPHAGSFVQQTSQSSSDGGNWQKPGMWRQWWVLLQPLAKELPVHHPAAFSCLPLPFLLGNSLPLLSAWTVSKGKMGPGTPPKDLWPSPPLTQYSWPFFL